MREPLNHALLFVLICTAALQSCATQVASERSRAANPLGQSTRASKPVEAANPNGLAQAPQGSDLPDAGSATTQPPSAANANTVRDVPWLSATLDFAESEGAGFSGGPITFANGYYAQLDESGICSVCVGILQVSFGDLTGDAQDEAVLLVSTNMGGAGNMLWAYVFQISEGVPRLLADIEGGDRGEGGIESVAIRKGAVDVHRFALGADDGTCCPSMITSERWKWIDGAMRQQGDAKVIQRRGKKPWRDASQKKRSIGN
jgi:hypothetical protein